MGFSLKVLTWLSLALLARSDEHYYNKFSVCDNSYIVVDDISLLCDSPGTYYYGSGKYRNSASCQAGDKAKVEVVFKIAQDLTDVYDPIYVDMFISGYGTVAGVQVLSQNNLCASNKLTSTDGVKCPAKGYYKLYYSFYWGSQDDEDEYEYAFVPKVTIGFTSNPNKGQYDLGGANTGKCSGDTFTSWTKGVRKSASNTIKTFAATFGILLCAVLAVFAAGWLIMKQAVHQPKHFEIQDPLDETNENNKFKLMGDSKNTLLDVA